MFNIDTITTKIAEVIFAHTLAFGMNSAQVDTAKDFLATAAAVSLSEGQVPDEVYKSAVSTFEAVTTGKAVLAISEDGEDLDVLPTEKCLVCEKAECPIKMYLTFLQVA